MEVPREPPRPNPVSKANFVSKLVFFWFWPVFRLGYRQKLRKEDLWDPPGDTGATRNADQLESAWNQQLSQGLSKTSEPVKVPLQENPGAKVNSGYILFRALVSTFGSDYILAWPLIIVNDCVLRVIQPYFMLLLVRSFITTSSSTSQYLFATGICVSTLILTLTNNPCQFYLGKLGQRCRIALGSLIQRKMERVSVAETDTNQGQITVLISNDAACLENNVGQIPYLLVAPLQLAIFMWTLYDEFGVSSVAGVGFILLYMPVQYWNGSLSTRYRQKIGKEGDERVRALTEVIEAIHSVKMYAWENIFQRIIQGKRKSEVKQLKRRSTLHAVQMSIFLTSSRVVPFLTFAVFVLSGGPLTADRVFYAVAVYNTVSHFILFNLPAAIRGVGEVKGSLQRIEAFLLLEETPQNSEVYKETLVNPGTRYPVQISNATASYQRNANPVVSNINLQLRPNSLVMIIGKVGSGKSSLLNLILNELVVSEGSLVISSRLSYAPQESYLFPGSIRRNVLFKTDDVMQDQDRYARVISASALSADIDQLEKGDETKIVGLSGGQRSRVNLARALYHDADVYLLDDPLSAVDAGVSRQIVDNALKGFLRGKLRILVTHQLQYLNEADHIVVMENGSIRKQGTYAEVEDVVLNIFGRATETGDVDSLVPSTPSPNKTLGPRETSVGFELDEEAGEGSLGLRIYWKYFKSGKSKTQVALYFLIFLIAQIFTTLIECWLALWTNAEEETYEHSRNETLLKIDDLNSFQHFIQNLDSLEQRLYLYIYLILTAIVFLTNLAKAVAFFYFSMRICINLHKRMLQSLMRAQVSFFEENGKGRITNRFSKDVNVVDEKIPFQFFDMFTIFLQVGTVILLIVLAMWYAVVAVVLFLLALGYVRGYYVTTSRDLKRIDGTTRSPVLEHVQSTFSGLVTIRAFKAEKILSAQFDHLQDRNSSATISFLVASQCFNIWIESLATLLLTFVAFGFLIAQNCFGVTFQGGNVGLAICSAVSLTIWLQYGMKVSADVENLMVSVERALQYTKLEPEAPLEAQPDKKPPDGWPTRGEIHFRNVSLSYDGSHDILRNLDFQVRGKEKIGAVGKTGAGKSSIIRGLFRMTEIKSGVVTIDNIDISKIGLHDLRKNIAVIPQKPHLFKGTVAFNLNPGIIEMEPNSADLPVLRNKMRETLNQIGLRLDLDDEIEMNGSNLCMGERQLMSLARALITSRRIVCLDEATAHIDSATDRTIQAVLRSQLVSCTVITIAHRLGTVIESDRILVLSEGQLLEFGHAHQLLQNKTGHFAMMVNNTGSDAHALKECAKEDYDTKCDSHNGAVISQNGL